MLQSPRRSILDNHGPHRRSSVTRAPVNRVERLARRFDSWQQRHPPIAFRRCGDEEVRRRSSRQSQIHDQLGVATFGNAFSLTVGVLGALFGGRGFANALQNTFSTLWSVPKVDRPGFPTKYLRAAGLLLLLTVGAAVTAAAGAAAGAATALGLHGLSARLISIAVARSWAYWIATVPKLMSRSAARTVLAAGGGWFPVNR
jgi:hypothetical protein